MVKTYFTFGQNHAHVYNNVTVDKDIVIEMETETHEEARARMFELFGQKWSNQYDNKIDLSYYVRGVLKI
jgi:hypothetical protein